ncbi:MAG: DASS family sodium-coupled anion symporter [Candidatus Margulisbacteria bacterium]|nr:DASS family sodium-coupled anion symporter [Candidatus Margulisiibacteriota bacterium]
MIKANLFNKIPKAKIIKNVILYGGLFITGFLFLVRLEGITQEAQNCLIIFTLAMTMWITRFIPLAATSLLVLAMLPLLGIMTAAKSFSLFGNEAVFFILGALVLSTGLRFSGLSKRVAFWFLNMLHGGAKRLMFGVLASALFLSFWMPEHAVVAMLLPMVIDIAKALKLQKLKSNYGKGLFIALAWGAVIGGVATLLGGARNPLAVGILREDYGLSISFFEWMVAAFPLVIIIGGLSFLIIYYFFPPEIKKVDQAKKYMKEEINNMGEISFREKKMGLIMIITVIGWIFFSEKIGLANIAILGAVSIFLLHIVTWEEIEKDVYWGAVLMYGGAIALAKAMTMTGAAKWLVFQFIDNMQFTPLVLIAVLALITKGVTESISNSAAVALILPIAFVLGDQYGVTPVIIVFTVAITAGLAFCLPIGTPPNALCFSAGYYAVKDVVKAGLVLNFISWIIFILIAKYYWPIIGLKF